MYNFLNSEGVFFFRFNLNVISISLIKVKKKKQNNKTNFQSSGIVVLFDTNSNFQSIEIVVSSDGDTCIKHTSDANLSFNSIKQK